MRATYSVSPAQFYEFKRRKVIRIKRGELRMVGYTSVIQNNQPKKYFKCYVKSTCIR